MPFINSLQRILGVIFSPFKPVHDFFKPAYDFFMKTLTVWLTLIGLACVIEGGMKFFGLNDTTAKVLSSIGIAVLVSGVSGVLLRSLEYSDIFKRELNDIIYGSTHPEEQKNLIKLFREELNDLIYGIKDPQERKDIINLVKEGILEVTYDAKVLRNRRDLSDLWKTVSETVYVNRFPDISRDIAERIAGEYFPTENDFYYSKFKEDVSIKFLDGHKKYVVAKETITLTIKPVDNLQSVDWVFGIELEKVPSDKVTSYEIKMLKICGEPSAYRPPITVSSDGRKLLADLKIPLEGANEYPVVLVQEKIYDLELNQERDVTSSRFIKAPELHVVYPVEDLEARFVPAGTREDAYEPQGGELPLIWNVYKGLIFPNQGYRLLLRRKQSFLHLLQGDVSHKEETP